MIPEVIEALIAQRETLAEKASGLHAKYGAGGTYFTEREILFAELAKEYRAKLEEDEEKVTQGHLEELVKTDRRYRVFVKKAEMERTELWNLYARMKSVTFRLLWLTRSRSLDDDLLAAAGRLEAEPEMEL